VTGAGGITEIYLVRHGETDWNRAGRLQGTIDTLLNPIGVVQAHQLADRFRAVDLSAVVTSPLARAQRTAYAIAEGRRSAFVVDPLLAEIDHGTWAGLTMPMIARTSSAAMIDDHLPPEALDGSGGESLSAAYRRASTVLRRLVAAAPAHPVVVVSHGIINALVMCAAAGHVPADIDQYTQPNGRAYRLHFRRRALVAMDCQLLSGPSAGPTPDADGRSLPCCATR
jgi:broad specificity phosphatase PhoE